MFSGPIGDRKRTKQTHNLKNYAEKLSFYWPILSQIAQNMTLWRAGAQGKFGTTSPSSARWHHP